MSKPLNKMTKAELVQVIAAKDAELVALRAQVSRTAAPARSEFSARMQARRDAAARYFAANPGARSVTPAQLVEFLEAHA